MNYCPNCGSKLFDFIKKDINVKKCNACDFIDWDNWTFVSCITVAYNKNNEFLMVELKGAEAGKLTFPGGYRELGETIEDAAKREFNEETGMKVKQLKLYKTYVKDSQRLIWIVFKGEIDDQKFIENDEVVGINYYNKQSPINDSQLRGELTKQLLRDIINDLSKNDIEG